MCYLCIIEMFSGTQGRSITCNTAATMSTPCPCFSVAMSANRCYKEVAQLFIAYSTAVVKIT